MIAPNMATPTMKPAAFDTEKTRLRNSLLSAEATANAPNPAAVAANASAANMAPGIYKGTIVIFAATLGLHPDSGNALRGERSDRAHDHAFHAKPRRDGTASRQTRSQQRRV